MGRIVVRAVVFAVAAAGAVVEEAGRAVTVGCGNCFGALEVLIVGSAVPQSECAGCLCVAAMCTEQQHSCNSSESNTESPSPHGLKQLVLEEGHEQEEEKGWRR